MLILTASIMYWSLQQRAEETTSPDATSPVTTVTDDAALLSDTPDATSPVTTVTDAVILSDEVSNLAIGDDAPQLGNGDQSSELGENEVSLSADGIEGQDNE